MKTLSIKKSIISIAIFSFIAIQFSGCIIDPNRHFRDSPRQYDSRDHDNHHDHDNKRQHDNHEEEDDHR